MKQTLSSAEVNQGYTPDGAEENGGTDHKEVSRPASSSYQSTNYHSAMSTVDLRTIFVLRKEI